MWLLLFSAATDYRKAWLLRAGGSIAQGVLWWTYQTVGCHRSVIGGDAAIQTLTQRATHSVEPWLHIPFLTPANNDFAWVLTHRHLDQTLSHWTAFFWVDFLGVVDYLLRFVRVTAHTLEVWHVLHQSILETVIHNLLLGPEQVGRVLLQVDMLVDSIATSFRLLAYYWLNCLRTCEANLVHF